MAAGFIQTTVTTTTGETVELTFWSADTSNPTTANTFNVTSGAVAHDGADAVPPIKMGGYGKAAAPSDVSADADVVNAWFLRNGAQAINITAAGALIPGDATLGLRTYSTAAFAASATFTPAASSHTGGSAGVIGDCNGATQTFTFSPAPVSGSVIMITDAELEIDGATAEATAWRLYLYNVTPPSAIADDGAFAFDSGDRASALGYIDLGTAVDHGNTQWVETHGINKMVKLAGTTVFGYLVNLTTLTPQNVAHVVKLYGTPV